MQILRLIVTPLSLLIGLMITSASAADARKPEKVSFYFAAHEDDWQLFMNPSAFDDVTGGASKAVFVHMTAGDAGLGLGTGGRKFPYYLARENGAEAAMRFMADANDVPAEKTAAQLPVNAHSLYRMTYRNTVGYFLRLPDGNPSGSGYDGTGFQSLKRLANGDNDSISAINGSTSYHGWSDLVGTLRSIINFERGSAATVQINVAELDSQMNPDDHSDHLMTAKAALDAAKGLPCVRRVSYVDYASAKLPENLNSLQRDEQSSVYAVTLSGVLALDHRTSWRHYDESFIGRSYFHVADPAPSCSVLSPTLSSAK